MDRGYVGFSTATNQRRRRIAFAGIAEDADDGSSEHAWHGDADEPSVSEVVSADRLLNRLVSQRAYKLWLTAGVLIVIAVLSVWLDWIMGRGASATRTSASGLLQTSTVGCSFSRGFSSASLFLAGQAAILIGWVRSGSDFDFRGHYRVWKWFGGASVLISAIVLTGLYVAMTDIAAGALEPFIGRVRLARPALLIVPLSLAGLSILMRVVPDMRRCRSSQGLLAASLLMALSRIGWLLNPASHLDDLLSNGLLAGASWLLLASMMRHAWFVTHICNDPPVSIVKPKAKKSKNKKPKALTVEKQAGVKVATDFGDSPDVDAIPAVAAEHRQGGAKRTAKPVVDRSGQEADDRDVDDVDWEDGETSEVAGTVQDNREARRARKRLSKNQKRNRRKAG